MSEYTARIQAILDTSKIPEQVAGIGKTPIKLSNISLNTKGFVSEIQSELDKHKFKITFDNVNFSGLEKQFDAAFKNSGQSFSRGINNRLADSLDFSKIDSSIAKVTTQYQQLGSTGHHSLSIVADDLQKLRSLSDTMKTPDIDAGALIQSYQRFENTLARVRNTLTTISAEGKRGINLDKSIESVTAKYQDFSNSGHRSLSMVKSDLEALRNLSSTIKSPDIDADTLAQSYNEFEIVLKRVKDTLSVIAAGGKRGVGLETDIAKVTTQYQQLGSTGHHSLLTVANDLEKLRTLSATMQEPDIDADNLIASYREFETVLTRVKSTLSTIKTEDRQSVGIIEVGKLDNEMSSWLQKNTKAAGQFGSSIDALRSRLSTLNASGSLTRAEFENVRRAFEQTKIEAERLGKTGQTLGSQMTKAFGSILRYVSVATILSQLKEVFEQMAQNVLAVDTAMTGLYRVTNLTDEGYKNLYKRMTSSAKEYGAELTDIINSTADWAKLGFNAYDAQKLANVTSMYQHVTDLEHGAAVDDLVTAYKGFQDQLLQLKDGDVTKAVEYVADIFNELGNKFAVEASDVGAALKNSASALEVAGNSIQQSSAMATGMIEVTQNASRAGNALRTLSMRLRGTTAEELTAIGEDAEGLIEVTSKMNSAMKDLTGVSLVDSLGELRSTYEVMDDLANVWDSLSGNVQSNVLEMIAGKNRASDVAAMINNWEQVEAAMRAATNATGSAAKENASYVDSLQGKLNKLTTAWQSLSNTVLEADFLKGLVDAGTGILSVFDGVIEKIGTIPTLIGAITAALSLKNVGELINQFQFRIILRVEYAHEAFTNGNMNEVARRLAA